MLILIQSFILILSFDEIHGLDIEDLIYQILIKFLPHIVLDQGFNVIFPLASENFLLCLSFFYNIENTLR